MAVTYAAPRLAASTGTSASEAPALAISPIAANLSSSSAGVGAISEQVPTHSPPPLVTPPLALSPQAEATAGTLPLPTPLPAPASDPSSIPAPQASLAIVAPTPSSAEAILRTPGVTLVDYPVRGITYAEITKELDLFSTGGAGGAKSDFGFSWVLSWNYTTDPITNQPEVKVAPRFNVELPRWTNFDSASPRDKELWASYRALLLRGIEARILLVQAFVPRAESDIQNFVARNPKAKQLEIDDVLNSTIRVLQTRLRALQSTEANDFPRKPLLAIGAP